MTLRIAFESFGVRVAVEVDGPYDAEVVDRVRAVLPPGARTLAPSATVHATVGLVVGEDRCTVRGAGGGVAAHPTEADALFGLDREIRSVVSLLAPRHVFVHAGVVAVAGGAIVIPGRSFTGKTSLVGALVSHGATYLSDEYAVLDADGRVRAYPRPLSFRTAAGRLDVAGSELGTVGGAGSLPVGLVVTTRYAAGTTWQPTEGTAASCALDLLDNAVAARVRPAAVLAAVAAVGRTARHLTGARGDAADTARALLDAAGHRRPAVPHGPVPVS